MTDYQRDTLVALALGATGAVAYFYDLPAAAVVLLVWGNNIIQRLEWQADFWRALKTYHETVFEKTKEKTNGSETR